MKNENICIDFCIYNLHHFFPTFFIKIRRLKRKKSTFFHMNGLFKQITECHWENGHCLWTFKTLSNLWGYLKSIPQSSFSFFFFPEMRLQTTFWSWGAAGWGAPCGASKMRGDVQDFSLRGSHTLSPSCCQNQQYWEVLGGKKRKSQLRQSCVQNSKLQSLPERAEKNGWFHHYRHWNRLGPYSAIFSGSRSLYQPHGHYPLPSAYFLLALEDLKRTQHSLSLLRVNHQEIWRPSAEMMFCISKFTHFQTKSVAAAWCSAGFFKPLDPKPP